MTKSPDLVRHIQVKGRWMLHEPDGLVSIDCPVKGFETKTEAIIKSRKINRERLGLPPDEDAFNEGKF